MTISGTEFLGNAANRINLLINEIVREAQKHVDIEDDMVRPAIVLMDRAKTILLTSRHLHALKDTTPERSK